MKQNKTTTKLFTDNDMAVIENLQNNPDPTSRLRSDYYNLRYRQIMSSYQDDISSCNFYGDRVKIQQSMLEAMKELRIEYDADLNHAIALHLSTLLIWVPWGKSDIKS